MQVVRVVAYVRKLNYRHTLCTRCVVAYARKY